eukprot:CAMPEP_0201492162 /NCGR_PEP_ID=MMETSP0151_2-20130828/32113_1 /ASSEMBLY_ACC=CAM_ASM_000257 /TAXON_ID=200890 /ORGANISM="Paramoeba atlantica, Strain 621/1 / CCAP 1560/9" /LENGTH=52 /DNA_ID=CAMNT_0047878831 /DNA_START=120 /DNA_END=274 /DNA_ORIENTATION=-
MKPTTSNDPDEPWGGASSLADTLSAGSPSSAAAFLSVDELALPSDLPSGLTL